MNKIPLFIFSKDRACQLRLLIESLATNCPQLFAPFILWKASNDSFLAGYEKLMLENLLPDITWVKEKLPIREHFVDTLDWAASLNNTLCISTDDCVFYHPTNSSPANIIAFFKAKGIWSFSFRLGLNTTLQDYKCNSYQPALTEYTAIASMDDLSVFYEHIRWNFKKLSSHLNYGYAAGQDFCMYRASDLLDAITGWDFQKMRDLEGGLSGEPRRSAIKADYMVSFIHSKVVNIPINTVQQDGTPAGVNQFYSLEELNRRYLDDEVIDLQGFDFSNIVGCHMELPIKFKKLSDIKVSDR